MKRLLVVVILVLSAAPAFSASTAPSLKALLTEAEWKRAGLDRLSPDEIGVIDAALIRHNGRTRQQHEADLAATRQAAGVSDSQSGEGKRPGFFARFGFFDSERADWREVPPLEANVVKWLSANRFELDNGQHWEGLQPIPYELAGKAISIHARPNKQFALSVDGHNTTLRVKRVR